MRNYQHVNYTRYYMQITNEDCLPVTRRECFAPVDEPNAVNPYKQRWFYDPEAGYAVRLLRSEAGDNIGKRNAADLRAEERRHARKGCCVWKNTDRCDQNCARCNHPHTVGIMALDRRRYVNCDDSMDSPLELPDESADVEVITENRELLFALMNALKRLSPEDRLLWDLMKQRVRKQEVAVRFNLTLDGVYYREKRLREILRMDSALKKFFRNY